MYVFLIFLFPFLKDCTIELIDDKLFDPTKGGMHAWWSHASTMPTRSHMRDDMHAWTKKKTNDMHVGQYS
jgi:hypothetical protein